VGVSRAKRACGLVVAAVLVVATATKSWHGPDKKVISVYRDPPGIEPPEDPAPMAILGGRGEIGNDPLMEWEGHQDMSVISAAFSWCGSRWALVRQPLAETGAEHHVVGEPSQLAG
jgi:hypothetical protein